MQLVPVHLQNPYDLNYGSSGGYWTWYRQLPRGAGVLSQAAALLRRASLRLFPLDSSEQQKNVIWSCEQCFEQDRHRSVTPRVKQLDVGCLINTTMLDNVVGVKVYQIQSDYEEDEDEEESVGVETDSE